MATIYAGTPESCPVVAVSGPIPEGGFCGPGSGDCPVVEVETGFGLGFGDGAVVELSPSGDGPGARLVFGGFGETVGPVVDSGLLGVVGLGAVPPLGAVVVVGLGEVMRAVVVVGSGARVLKVVGFGVVVGSGLLEVVGAVVPVASGTMVEDAMLVEGLGAEVGPGTGG